MARKLIVLVLGMAAIAAIFVWPAYRKNSARRKLATTLQSYRTRAERGDASAQFRLGTLYDHGLGVSQDSVQAVRWYRSAAGQGNVEAQSALGYCYYHGRGLPQDRTQALHWYRQAAERGNASAQGNLADMYLQGEVVSRDEAEAARWFRKAANQGDAIAQAYLGHAYRVGLGVPKDNLAAAGWYLRVLWHCVLQLGWASFFSLALAIGAVVLAGGRWGIPGWFTWALLSASFAAQVFHLLASSGGRRVAMIVFFALLSSLFALAAFATRDHKQNAHPNLLA